MTNTLVFLHVTWYGDVVGPFVWALPSKVSALWFPANQRTAATAWSTMAQNIGTVLGGIAGVIVVDIHQLQRFVYISSVVGVSLMILALFDHLWPAQPLLPPSISTALQGGPSPMLGISLVTVAHPLHTLTCQ
jgi:predicted MFS family arabinose efflux permease